MADDTTRQLIQRAATTLRIRNLANRRDQMQPHMRPHTWVFLRQPEIKADPITCLGIVFKEWPKNKYNMVKFTSHTHTGKELKTSGLLTALDNGDIGLVLQVRWPWGALLKEYKGLSAGDL